jgi:hypothetical protein
MRVTAKATALRREGCILLRYTVLGQTWLMCGTDGILQCSICLQ